ncbi:hypothetical protein GCM10011348_35060 [Marinobacterium nitratireducens]|uniref:Uncharacterized protein n=1 Tax=Marinobacterium nitratireducens TaxID=518897 RepID=A0A917ZKN9_9GAMM|nr:hypothetical protein [Marinobacterium nitratireducens]GGO85761.1 hypothetical protein GCM10011348_35060 [Marinobacterium nitratireducens]
MRVTYQESVTTGLSRAALRQENIRFEGTDGISQNNRSCGFRPAFLDTLSGRTYLSRFASGVPAPLHLLEGLPAELVVSGEGQALRIRATVISGFVLDGRFYTRDQAVAYALGGD